MSTLWLRVQLVTATLLVVYRQGLAQLRTTRQMRQAKGGTSKSGLGQIVDAASDATPSNLGR